MVLPTVASTGPTPQSSSDGVLAYASRHRDRVRLRRSTRLAQVAVVDTGPGIPAKHVPHIWNRFYRVDKARSRAVNSTRLGLAIVKYIAEAHGGRVSVASTPGSSTTFTVMLPLARRYGMRCQVPNMTEFRVLEETGLKEGPKRCSFVTTTKATCSSLAGSCTARDLFGFAGIPQASVKRFDHRVMLRGAQRRHIQRGPQTRVARVPNRPAAPHTAPRLSGN